MTQSQSTGSPADGVHELHCMEIWGGNEAIDNAISTPGIDAWFYSRPYHDDARGGDVHYASMCAAGRIARFVVADVSGHGSAVDDFAQRLRSLMRKHVNTPDQTKFTRALNDDLLSQDTGGLFVTALLITFFAPRSQLIFCNAGHPKPLWFRAETQKWAELDCDDQDALGDAGNLPLGVIEPTAYHQFAIRIAPGDLVLTVTDGVTEAKGPDGRLLGCEGLLDIVRQIPRGDLHQFVPTLIAQIAAYRQGAPADDDLTVMLLHHNDAPPRSIGITERVGAMAKMLGLGRL